VKINIKKLERLAREKEKENLDFIFVLKSSDHHGVDRIVHQLNKKYCQEIDCTDCANCCKKLAPALSQEETERIASFLKLTYGEFEEKYIKRKTPQGILLKGPECPFLSENKCSVYEYRPEACRSYPHLHRDNINHRLISFVDNTFICPIAYKIMEDLKAYFDTEN